MSQPAYDHEDGDLELTAPWERAIDTARHGKVAWLAEHRERKFALLPADLAEAALEALEDAEDLAAIKEARAERAAGIPGVPLEQIIAELEADEQAAKA